MLKTLASRAYELGGSVTAPVGAYFAAKEWLAERALTLSAQFGDLVLLDDRTFTPEWMAAGFAFLVANRLGGEIDRQRVRSIASKIDSLR